MKTVLVGINSKYIHTCLAIWYLKANLNNALTVVREFTINDSKDNILAELYKEKPDMLAFSCYIWNIELINLLICELKKLLPKCTIVLGGPEVSYNAADVLLQNPAVDFVLCGEGEEIFSSLQRSIIEGNDEYKNLNGIAYREESRVHFKEGFNLIKHLDSIKTPYTPDLMKATQNRIIYYESSRGCPFSCSYCISSTFNGVRYFSFDRVKQDLTTLLMYKPKLIKFVDRTFNCNKKRATEILEYIIALDCDTIFHFEAAADLFDADILEILKKAPKGRIQLEIGLQTTNIDTLNEIDRVTDLDKLKRNVDSIINAGNIHMHLDLIAGLPYEGISSFKNSFNEVYKMRPHQFQLGFLKLLKGSKIRIEAAKHGYSYKNYSPYEILENNYITFEEILYLKDIEEVLERYFNSGRFINSLKLLEQCLSTEPYEVFRLLSVYCRDNGYLDRPISYRENIAVIFRFVQTVLSADRLEQFRQAMVYDFLSTDSSCAIPECINSEGDLVPVGQVHEFLQNVEFVADFLPSLIGLQAKNILKKVYFVKLDKLFLSDEIILFDYSMKDKVTEKFRNILIKK